MLTSTLLTILSFLHLSLQHQTPTEQIRNTLSLWSFYLDTADYTSLPNIFTPNATLILPAPFDNGTGIAAITSVLIEAAGNDTTVHALTWQVIDVDEGGERAGAKTGFTDYHFGNGGESGQQRTIWGYYDDVLVKNDGRWLIEKRDSIKTAGPFYSVSSPP